MIINEHAEGFWYKDGLRYQFTREEGDPAPIVWANQNGFMAYERHVRMMTRLPRLKAGKLKAIARLRFDAETGGLTLPDGTAIATDRDSQAMINAAMSYLAMQPEGATIRWKADSGWIDIDLTTLQTIGQAVGAHVQACFGHESDLAAEVEAAATPQDLEAITWSL